MVAFARERLAQIPERMHLTCAGVSAEARLSTGRRSRGNVHLGGSRLTLASRTSAEARCPQPVGTGAPRDGREPSTLPRVDEHLRRVVARLYEVRECVRLGQAPPGTLLAACREAELAIDHAQPEWLHLLEGTTLRVDVSLDPWPPPAPGDDRRTEALDASSEFATWAERLLQGE